MIYATPKSDFIKFSNVCTLINSNRKKDWANIYVVTNISLYSIPPILFSLFSVYLVYVNSFSPKMCISISKLNNCAYQVPSYLWKSSMQWIWLVASTVNGIPSKLFPHTTQVKQAGWYGFPVALRSYNNKPNTWTPIENI